MIKFFRKIRQNLLNKGKTSRYFKYAIGEILLVVIGILIALQINNWNNLQIIYAQEKGTLIKLVDDLKSDNRRFKDIIAYYKEHGQKLAKQKKLIFKKELSEDEVKIAMEFSGAYIQSLNPRRASYDKMLNTGRIYSLSSQEIVNTIIEYYQLLEKNIYSNKEDRREFRSLFFGAELADFWFWKGDDNPLKYAKIFFKEQDSRAYRLLKQSAGWSVAINSYIVKDTILLLDENIKLIEAIQNVLKDN